MKANKTIIEVGIILIALGAIISLAVFINPTGQAISGGAAPQIASVNLINEQTFSVPLTKNTYTPWRINTSLVDGKKSEIFLTLTKENDHQYNYQITDKTKKITIAIDTLSTKATKDTSLVYFDRDELADLSVTLENNQLVITNLHHLSPSTSTITLLTPALAPLPRLIQVPLDSVYNMTARAESGSVAPTITTSLGTPDVEKKDATRKLTQVNISYKTPKTSQVQQLTLTATAGGKQTTKTYTLAIGNVIYALRESQRPNITVENSGKLTIDFTPTMALQPLALPCTVADLDKQLKGKGISRIYGYNVAKKDSQIWSEQTRDFNELSEAQGYFVQLAQPKKVLVSLTCSKPLSFLPKAATPQLRTQTFTLNQGWQLFSLPGIHEQSLDEFLVDTTQLEIYECKQGSSAGRIDCTTKLLGNTKLNPGIPYWINAKKALSFTYVRQ